ncbi:MAG: hypothetical protein OEU91_08660 [Gammaproteobacteria bacterium]|nr:hypothetical protein [Gammaproteobacteria bacterium]
MKKIPVILISLGLLSATPALAVDGDAIIGGAIGGGVGAAVGSEIGGREGAIAGGAIGAAVGVAVATDGDGHDVKHAVHVEDKHSHGPPGHAYGHHVPPGHAKHKKKHH